MSLTSVICQLLEIIIRDHMMHFLIKHKLINPSQHGFLKARSCLTNLLCFLEEITKWVDDGSPVDLICLDFQKAFDKVPHQRLILKLKLHGMGNSIINWIEQWLTATSQMVVVDGDQTIRNVCMWMQQYHVEKFISTFPDIDVCQARWPGISEACQNDKMATPVNSLFFEFKMSFLPKYCDYMYIVKWCSVVACNWCVSLDIVLNSSHVWHIQESILL